MGFAAQVAPCGLEGDRAPEGTVLSSPTPAAARLRPGWLYQGGGCVSCLQLVLLHVPVPEHPLSQPWTPSQSHSLCDTADPNKPHTHLQLHKPSRAHCHTAPEHISTLVLSPCAHCHTAQCQRAALMPGAAAKTSLERAFEVIFFLFAFLGETVSFATIRSATFFMLMM